MITEEMATIMEISSGLVKELANKVAELEAERDKLRARLNDLHDVPPEHESEPLAFHRGWELAIRAVSA